MAISTALRFQILRRDGFRCTYCGATPGEQALQVDHVVPEVLGGSNEPGNLTTACAPCNQGKAATPPDASMVAQVESDAKRWAAAIEIASRRQQMAGVVQAAALVAWRAEWDRWQVFGAGEPVPLPDGWQSNVMHWTRLGVDLQTVLIPLVGAVMGSNHVQTENIWNYYCGCAWKRVRALQQEATRLINAGLV